MTRTPLALTLMILAAPALAHTPPDDGAFVTGLAHPVFGLDHALTMVMVAIWAALLRGRALWVLPLGFVIAMELGYVAAIAGVPVPMVEPMILMSLLIMGFVIAHALRVRAAAAGILVAGFAVFHGAAHGAVHSGPGALSFGLGFTLASIGLLASGLLLALVVRRACGTRAVKAAGVVAAAAGVLAMTAG